MSKINQEWSAKLIPVDDQYNTEAAQRRLDYYEKPKSRMSDNAKMWLVSQSYRYSVYAQNYGFFYIYIQFSMDLSIYVFFTYLMWLFTAIDLSLWYVDIPILKKRVTERIVML